MCLFIIRIAGLFQHLTEQAVDVTRFYWEKYSRLTVPALLVPTYFAWAWGQDWVRVEDWTRNGKVLFALIGISCMAAVYIARQIHWTVALFHLYVNLQWIWLRIPALSLVEITMVNACLFAAIFIHREDRKNLLGTCLFLDGLLQASLGLIEIAGYFPFLKITNLGVWAPVGALGHPTVLGPYLAVALPFVLCAPKLVKNTNMDIALRLVAAGVITACVLLTQSTMTWVSFIVVAALALGFFVNIRTMLLSVAGGIIAFGAIFFLHPEVASPSGRLPHWVFAWNHLTPMGYGSGTWMVVNLKMTKRGDMPWGQLHNDVLQGAFEYGLGMVPLGIGLIVLFTITWKAMQFKRREMFPWAAMFFGILADSLGSFPLHTMPMGVLFCIAAVKIFRFDFEEDRIRTMLEGQD